jgi:ribonuclease HI
VSEPDPRPGYSVPVVDTDRPYTTVWTDGSSTGRWGPGGWAWCVVDGPLAGQHASGGHEHTTNQRMELLAAHEAVNALPGLLLVVSDSAYVVNCFRDQWWKGWQERRWRKVANDDLWRPFITDVLDRRGEVRFAWVKGHAGLPGNEEADRLAKAAKIANTPDTERIVSTA